MTKACNNYDPFKGLANHLLPFTFFRDHVFSSAFFVELIGVGATRCDVLWQSIRILIKIVTALATHIYGLKTLCV